MEPHSRHNCIQRERDGELNALINSLSYYIAHIKQGYNRVVEERGTKRSFGVLPIPPLPLFVLFSIIYIPLDTRFHISLRLH